MRSPWKVRVPARHSPIRISGSTTAVGRCCLKTTTPRVRIIAIFEASSTASSDGTYYIEAGAFLDSLSGTYEVYVSHAIIGDGNVNNLNGTAENDSMRGFARADTLIAGAGADTLTGGLGKDLLTGGVDADIFDFNSKFEAGKGLNCDVIQDFVKFEDRIDLFDIDARQGGANNAFKFIGPPVSTTRLVSCALPRPAAIPLSRATSMATAKPTFRLSWPGFTP